ncbi:hypothetical protein [Hasllibacter sp. MH4015]|uniref:hypothetical protein n=1 Tax=Hasllibacter sp. MH4015 TaxID=2854029 RepID=UPI001CD1EB12|nr:hypothetical protein [Hasllibacter sp. MH4015]
MSHPAEAARPIEFELTFLKVFRLSATYRSLCVLKQLAVCVVLALYGTVLLLVVVNAVTPWMLGAA